MVRVWVVLALLAASPAWAQRWVTSWAGSVQGAFPAGHGVAQPELKFALPDGTVHDQTFRMIVRPSLWGRRARLRFSNVFGAKPLVLDGAFVGLQMSGATVAAGTNRPVTFKGKRSIAIAVGADAWSDAVTLPFVADPAAADLQGRKLAVSFHIAGDAGAPTWHALAMQTSYMTPSGAGSLGELEDGSVFPSSTTSWFIVDALDMQAAPDVSAVVCLGDSITDGTGSTLNGDDRWPDDLGRRLLAGGITMGVVDAGIAGNRVASADKDGGAAAGDRLERDVSGLSGVTHVIWLEGINDIGGGATVAQVRDAMTEAVKRIRAKIKGVKVLGGTLTPIAGPGSGSPDEDARRRGLNDFIRNSGGVFDGVVDFERATMDRGTGGLRPEFVPSSTVGGPGDYLHPNRAGYLAMGDAVDLRMLHAPPKPRPRPAPRPSESTDEGGPG